MAERNTQAFLSSKDHLSRSDRYDMALNTTTIEKKSIENLHIIRAICSDAVLPIYLKRMTQQHHTSNALPFRA